MGGREQAQRPGPKADSLPDGRQALRSTNLGNSLASLLATNLKIAGQLLRWRLGKRLVRTGIQPALIVLLPP